MIISGIEKASEFVDLVQSQLERFDEVKKDVQGDSDLEPDWDVTRNDSQNNSIKHAKTHLVLSKTHAKQRPAELWKDLIKRSIKRSKHSM